MQLPHTDRSNSSLRCHDRTLMSSSHRPGNNFRSSMLFIKTTVVSRAALCTTNIPILSWIDVFLYTLLGLLISGMKSIFIAFQYEVEIGNWKHHWECVLFSLVFYHLATEGILIFPIFHWRGSKLVAPLTVIASIGLGHGQASLVMRWSSYTGQERRMIAPTEPVASILDIVKRVHCKKG